MGAGLAGWVAKRCNRGDEEIVPVFDGDTLDGFLNPLMVISQAPCFDFAHNLGPEIPCLLARILRKRSATGYLGKGPP